MFGCVVLVVDGPQARAGAFGSVGGRRVVFFKTLLWYRHLRPMPLLEYISPSVVRISNFTEFLLLSPFHLSSQCTTNSRTASAALNPN